MADDKGVSDTEMTSSSDTEVKKVKKTGILSRVWNGVFRSNKDDLEKRLQYIAKEEVIILSRMKRRSMRWRRNSWNLILFSVILEVIAVGYAIMTTRSVRLHWKMRALRVLPMFLLPALSTAAYCGLANCIKICDLKDQKTLERLRAERQAKIDELKEKTNYYITQELIQKYDTDPAAKAAAAAFLASKLGADSGIKVSVGDESNINGGKSNDVQCVQSTGLRNRRQGHNKSSGSGTMQLHGVNEQASNLEVNEGFDSEHDQLVVDHYLPQGPATHDGGWLARLAALLVGEDPTQSYALMCGNCHMHNGLATKEDFPVITYYCPHCHALNGPKQLKEQLDSVSPDTIANLKAGSSTPDGTFRAGNDTPVVSLKSESSILDESLKAGNGIPDATLRVGNSSIYASTIAGNDTLDASSTADSSIPDASIKDGSDTKLVGIASNPGVIGNIQATAQ